MADPTPVSIFIREIEDLIEYQQTFVTNQNAYEQGYLDALKRIKTMIIIYKLKEYDVPVIKEKASPLVTR